jgi:hypothetical protein
MAVFIGLVFVAYVYIWKKGGLDWSSASPDLRDEEDDEGPVPVAELDEEYLGAR